MGNLNRRRAIGAARAAVRDDGGCLSRAARKRFTADSLLAGTSERPLCLPMRSSPGPCLCKHVAYWPEGEVVKHARPVGSPKNSGLDMLNTSLTAFDPKPTSPKELDPGGVSSQHKWQVFNLTPI
jgi:hypothetical protein